MFVLFVLFNLFRGLGGGAVVLGNFGMLQYAPMFGMAIIAENDLNYYDLVGKNHSV